MGEDITSTEGVKLTGAYYKRNRTWTQLWRVPQMGAEGARTQVLISQANGQSDNDDVKERVHNRSCNQSISVNEYFGFLFT